LKQLHPQLPKEEIFLRDFFNKGGCSFALKKICPSFLFSIFPFAKEERVYQAGSTKTLVIKRYIEVNPLQRKHQCLVYILEECYPGTDKKREFGHIRGKPKRH